MPPPPEPTLHRQSPPPPPVARQILSLLRCLLSKSLLFMDSLLFSNDDDDVALSTFDHSFLPLPSPTPASPSSSSSSGGGMMPCAAFAGSRARMESAVDSEILVNMKREEEAEASGEEGVSSGSGDLALKWHFERGNVESSYPGGDSAHDLFSLKIRLLFMSEERHIWSL
ncbi:ubiquitin carboxyl-terminal hydrolase, partial [Striga asiatica]